MLGKVAAVLALLITFSCAQINAKIIGEKKPEKVVTTYGKDDFRKGGNGVDITVEKLSPGHHFVSNKKVSYGGSDPSLADKFLNMGSSSFSESSIEFSSTTTADELASISSFPTSTPFASSTEFISSTLFPATGFGSESTFSPEMDIDTDLNSSMNNSFITNSTDKNGDEIITSLGEEDFRNGGNGIDITVEKSGPGHYSISSQKVSGVGGDRPSDVNEEVVYGPNDYHRGGEGVDVSITRSAPNSFMKSSFQHSTNTDTNPVQSDIFDHLSTGFDDFFDSEPSFNFPSFNIPSFSIPSFSLPSFSVGVDFDGMDDDTAGIMDSDDVMEKVTLGDSDYRKGGDGVDVKVEKTFPGGHSESIVKESHSSSENATPLPDSKTYFKSLFNFPTTFSSDSAGTDDEFSSHFDRMFGRPLYQRKRPRFTTSFGDW